MLKKKFGERKNFQETGNTNDIVLRGQAYFWPRRITITVLGYITVRPLYDVIIPNISGGVYHLIQLDVMVRRNGNGSRDKSTTT